VRFLHLLHDFDVKARLLEVKLEATEATSGKLVRMLAVVMASVAIASGATVVAFSMNFPFDADPFIPLVYGYLMLYLCLFMLQFVFAVAALKQRFQQLNDNLQLSLSNASATAFIVCQQRRWKCQQPNADEMLPKLIGNLFSILCDGIDLVNTTFTLQLIPFVVYYLSTNMLGIYSMLRELFHGSSSLLTAMGTNFWWNLLNTSLAVLPLHAGSAASRVAQQTPIVVAAIVRSQPRNCGRKVLKAFLMEIQFRKLHFENEFFCIDWKLLFSVSEICCCVWHFN